MRSIPDDVLTEVFQHCVASRSHDSLDLRNPPRTLSYVSRRWRDLSTFPFHFCDFGQLSVDFRKYEALSTRTILTRVALIPERSMNMDLSVMLLSQRTISDHPAFVLLDLSARRWRRFSVSVPRLCLQALPGASFTRICELSVSRPNGDAVVAPVTTFRTASFVRSVVILSDETSNSLPLPSSTIETYVCTSFTRGDWDYLKNLTALKSLKLQGRSKRAAFNLSELPQITLPTVTSLRVIEESDSDAGIAAKLFQTNSLVLPSLSTLGIHFHFLYDSTPSFPPSQLLKSLTTLIIQNAMHSAANTGPALRFLDTMAHVKKLVIDGRCGNELFQGLTVRPEKDVILPNLLVLQLLGHRRCFPDPVFLDFLESRCRQDCDVGGLGAVNKEHHNASQSRPVFLEEIDLSEVQLVP
ncbi:hypothetical protein EDD18DRAFT_1190537 [Armillaria luteobubalina]|uniref:F-box domain-containing protein n=1 Tax=Armillaria luteobubalina TaxID=153913 RepID=A0AA39PRG7_9AGAR|nr:hypothetical protein EDD18DRAFT_1190537 [Armillaria luteobubalina]